MIKKIIKDFLPWMNLYYKLDRYYRKANKLSNKYKILSNFYYYKMFKKYNCFISPHAEIDKGLICPHPTGIVIGEKVKIGKNAVIYQNVTLGRKNRDIDEYPTIGDNVVIYANSTIVGDIKIGNNVIIGCNSVVLRDVKDGEVVSGIVK